MRIRTSHTVLLTLATIGYLQVHAQAPLQVGLRPDQRVYVTGDDLWIDGWMDRVDTSIRWTRIRLLDRNGEMRAESTLRNEKGMFSGFLELPEELSTDVYFLDAIPTASSSVTGLQPVYLVNPRMPPTGACDEFKDQASKIAPADPSESVRIRTDKDSVGTGGRMDVSWSTVDGVRLREVFVQVVRQDALSDLMDSLCRGFDFPMRHGKGDPRSDLGHLVKARITRNGNPVQGVRCFAALLDYKANIAVSESDRDGIVEFLMPRSYDPTRLVVAPQSAANGELSVTLIETDSNPGRIPFPCVRPDPSMRSGLEDRILNSRLERRYHPEGVRSFDLSQNDTSDFYGKPDRRYLLDDYTRFPVMEEVFTDIIPEVRVRKESGAPVLQVLNTPMKSYFNRQGLVLLDGVPMSDAQAVLDIDPLRIRVIDVVSRPFMLGKTEFPGIIHLKSYKTDMAGNGPPRGSVARYFTGVQRTTAYPDTEESGGEKGVRPSLRNLVSKQRFSFPEGKAADRIRLNASDAVGRHRICVFGMDDRGKWIRGEKSIFVSAGERTP